MDGRKTTMTEQPNEDEVITSNPSEVQEQPEGEQIDYKTKFSESSKEALRLLEENKRKDAEIERLAQLATEDEPIADDNLYPGFEDLDLDSQENLKEYTRNVEKSVRDNIYKDPAIAFAREAYNEKKWNEAFSKVSSTIPMLAELKEEFKTKYYNLHNVPDNIDSILQDVAKIYLYDKAKDIGVMEEQQRAGRIELERNSGGEKISTATRSLQDWQKMQQENPAKFAKESKTFFEDLASGKLKE